MPPISTPHPPAPETLTDPPSSLSSPLSNPWPTPCQLSTDSASPQVSAFSTWEKELHKIVFDPRYLLLNSEERRQVRREPGRRCWEEGEEEEAGEEEREEVWSFV